ncbi:hypothetical protein APX70_200127 [Pseudomonas syringae pv. maculicola]|uniref:Uncharacterized protein n=1 Tax=Pseudomonas syringae pv. maculicola TaxID=59511 RepID=A0A3M2VHJ2_PSEYM|nr:hypothetical protein APX70_200127 [Pseudomonas syringae pv. maculicola]
MLLTRSREVSVLDANARRTPVVLLVAAALAS